MNKCTCTATGKCSRCVKMEFEARLDTVDKMKHFLIQWLEKEKKSVEEPKFLSVETVFASMEAKSFNLALDKTIQHIKEL